MKGKHFNANLLLTALFGIKKEGHAKTERTYYAPLTAHLLSKKKEPLCTEQATYRSVTALIH